MFFSLFLRTLLLVTIIFGLPVSHVRAKDTTTILFFGDSIVAGYGLSLEESPPAQLEKKLRLTNPEVAVINGGVSGDTTSAGRSRLEWTINKNNPDIVILALGGNDVLRGIPPKVTRENIDAMLNVLKQKDIDVILSSVQAPDNLGIEYKKEFTDLFVEIAEEYDVPLYPFLISETFGKREFMQSDGIHPNTKGAKLIADDLGEYLLEHYIAAR